MDSTISVAESEDLRAKHSLELVLLQDQLDYYKDSVNRMHELIHETAQKRSEFTETLAKQLWERNSEVDRIKVEFESYREKSDKELDTMRRMLQDERQEVEKLKEEKKQWIAAAAQAQADQDRTPSPEETKIDSESAQKREKELEEKLEKAQQMLENAVEKLVLSEEHRTEDQLKIQHELVTKKLLETSLKAKQDQIVELSAKLDSLKAKMDDKDERIDMLKEKLQEASDKMSEERRVAGDRDKKWNELLDSEQEKCQELEKELRGSEAYSAEWQRYSTELQAVLDNRDTEFEAIIGEKDQEILNLSRQIERVRTMRSRSVSNRSYNSAANSFDDNYLPPLN